MAYANNDYSFLFILNKNWKPEWQLHNARGHTAIGLSSMIGEKTATLNYEIAALERTAQISHWPVIDKSASHIQLQTLLEKTAQEAGVTVNMFTDSMFGSSAEEQLEQTRTAKDPQLLVVGLFGKTEVLRKLTKNLSLAKF